MEFISELGQPGITSLPSAPARQISLAERIEKRPARFTAIFTVIYFFGAVCAASHRYFVFDEIITSYIAGVPDIRQIWTLIGKGIELNPPLPFWIAWSIDHTVGWNEVTSRIPAIFGYWLMCFCLYWFVRRRCGVVFGFVAFLMPIFTFTAWESAIARGYGLMLGMSGLALLGWQTAADGERRKLGLTGLVTGIAVAVSCHYYAVYVAVAIGLGEIARSDRRWKLDFPIWAAIVIGLSPLAVYAELLRSAAEGASKNFWVSASPGFLYECYADLLGPTAMVFMLLLVNLLWPRQKNKAAEDQGQEAAWAASTLSSHEVVAALVLFAMPLVVYLAACFFSVPFYTRYLQPVVIGFTVIIAGFAYRIGANSIRFRSLLISLLVWFCLLPWTAWQTMKVFFTRSPAEHVQVRPETLLDSFLPIVFDSSDSDFIEFYHYGPPALREKVFVLFNSEAAVRFRGSDTAQRSLAIAQTIHDTHAVDYHKFLSSHREFLVVRMTEDGWVVQSLLAAGAKVTLVSLDKDPGFFVRSTAVYRVVIPDSTQ